MSNSGKSSSEIPRRQRKVHPKTRTGCKTCKIRKVKCDEAKPFCNRCSSTGRKCDGYPSSEPIRYSPPRSASPSSSALLGLSNSPFSIPGTSTEKRSFQYFIANTASELSGYFNEDFWSGLLLKASLGNHEGVTALRHAVIGIGALHEDFVTAGGVDERGLNSEFALAQYSKGITALRQTLTTSDFADSPLIALMSSALFVSFDTLRGCTGSALVHLQSGLKILKDARAQIKAQKTSNYRRSGKGISREDEHVMEKFLAPLLVRLSVQAILYIDSRPVGEKVILARALSGITDTLASELETTTADQMWSFESLEQARESLNMAAEAHFRTAFLCDPYAAWGKQSAEVAAVDQKATEYMKSWSKSFAAWMTKHSSTLTTDQIRGATILKVHACIIEVMHEIKPTHFDPRPVAVAMNAASAYNSRRVIEQFATIMSLASSLIKAQESDSQKAAGRAKIGVFSTDLGLVGPLYYVALKCTVPSMRSEAFKLLEQWKGREGMWDTTMSMKLVTDFWEIESKFGKRGYEAFENADESKKAKDYASRPRGHVKLQMGENGRWEWKVSLEMGAADARSVPSMPLENRSGGGGPSLAGDFHNLGFNNLDYKLNFPLDFDLDNFIQLEVDHGLQIDGTLYPNTTIEESNDWMSTLYTQGSGNLFDLPSFSFQDYGDDMIGPSLGMDCTDMLFDQSVSTPGSYYTNTSESVISDFDNGLLRRY